MTDDDAGYLLVMFLLMGVSVTAMRLSLETPVHERLHRTAAVIAVLSALGAVWCLGQSWYG